MDRIAAAAEAVLKMDHQLRDKLLWKDGVLQEKKVWDNTFIRHQAQRRTSGAIFTLPDHLRAMVYSMLSAGITWERVESGIDLATGRLLPIDKVFHDYNPDHLVRCTPADLRDKIHSLHCASQYTMKQMTALLDVNLPKLTEWERKCGSIDAYYQCYIEKDPTLKSLVSVLSVPESSNKLAQMGEALVAEYLKNVGYDLAKPDRHICRVLGRDYLGCSELETVPAYEAIDLIAEIALALNRPAAEVDYILWSYCANGYGGVCTVRQPRCELCVAKAVCRKKVKQSDGGKS